MIKNNNYQLLYYTLREIITNNYILLDLPYYPNVGDILNWEASLQLLKKIPYRCLYSCSIYTYKKPKIKSDTILLIIGGGNFGDLWEDHQIFRHQIMKDFPENPIVQLPQSVCFENNDKMLFDIQCFKNHRAPVTICLRDQNSFDIISNNYTNVKPLLLPDMVLALDIDKVLKRIKISRQSGNGVLYFRRNDKEFVENNLDVPFNAEGDWPCMQYPTESVRNLEKILKIINRLRMPMRIQLAFTRWYYRHIIKDNYLRDGINFLMPFRTIYATRLHAAILGTLLDKQVYIIDNSYNKCSGVYNLWMKNTGNISLL